MTREIDAARATPVVVADEIGEILNVNTEVLFEYSGANLVYEGRARPGTPTGQAAWAIRKFTYDGSGNLLTQKWADGTHQPVKIWDSRAAYTY